MRGQIDMRASCFRSAVSFLFLFTAVASAQEPPSKTKPLTDCFPSDTVAYLECPSLPDFIAGLKGTGLYALFNAPEMAAVRSAFQTDKASPPGDNQNLEILNAFRDFAQSVPGGLAIGIVFRDDHADWLAVVEIGPDASAALALLDNIYRLEAEAGCPCEKIEIEGVPVTVSAVDGECSALTQGLLLVGTRPLLESALNGLRVDSNSLSLSTSISFAKACSFLSPNPHYRVYVDATRAAAMLQAALAPFQSAPAVGPAIDRLNEILAGVDTVSAEGSCKLSGVLERACISTRSADSHLLDFAGAAQLDETRFALVPRSAFFCAASAGNVRGYLQSWRDVMHALQPAGASFQSVIESIEQRSGVSIERDILPHLATTSISYASLNGSGIMLPPLGALSRVTLIELADEKAVSDALDALADTMRRYPELLNPSPRLSGDSPFTFETATLGNLKIHYLAVRGAPTTSPAFAVYKGYLIHAAGKDTVSGVIDNIIAPGPSILESADFTRVRAALPKSVTQIAYVSLDSIVDLVCQFVIPLLASRLDAARAAGEIAFSSADIPSPYVIKRHVDGIAMSLTVAGNLVDAQAYTPTGVVPLAMLALLGGVSSTAGPAALGAPPEPETDAPRARLQEIARILQVSTIARKGSFPDAVTDEVSSDLLQAPQDPAPDSPVDYVYVKGLTTSSPGKRIILYERAELNPGGRNVLCVDGTVEFLSEQDFQTRLEGPSK